MNRPSFDGLSQPEANHIQLYSDPQIFELELERIFYSTWVYIAHDSEIPEVGDFKTTFIGRVPVVLTRDEDRKINLFINRCAHRGATVCAAVYLSLPRLDL